ALAIRAVGGGADVGQTAQPAFDHASQQVLVLGTPLIEKEMRLESFLRLLPNFLGHEGGDGAGYDWPVGGSPFPELMHSHVGFVRDQSPNPTRTPNPGCPLLPFSSEQQAIITNIGTWDAKLVQPDCYEPARFLFHG